MKRRKFVFLSMVSVLFLGLFSVAPASAKPDTDSGKVLKVAVIGDSYTAGNGAGRYLNDNADKSYFSQNNWGNVYVNWLKNQGVRVQFYAYDGKKNSLAYGGSVTDDLLCPQSGGYRQEYRRIQDKCVSTQEESNLNLGNQIARIPDDTDLVLLTIGGNDVHFSDIVKQCFAVGMRDAKGCEEKISAAYSGLDGVRSNTKAIFERLDVKLKPGAEVVLVGYPLLATTRPYVLTDRYGHENYYNYPAGAEVRALGQEATRMQQELVNEWNSQGGNHIKVRYVGSIADVFAGHEPDPSASDRNDYRWINEFLETETRIDSSGQARGNISRDKNNFYHPGVTGHEMIAREIARVVGVPGSVRVASKSEPVDVVLVVDGTGSMGQARSVLVGGIGQVFSGVAARSSSVRFGVVSYGDCRECGGDYVSRVDSDFTADARRIENAINRLDSIEHQKDVRQGTVYSGINTALDLDWRVDARKVVIVVGDGSSRDPEPDTGYTKEEIAQLSAEAGGVEVYAIDTSETWELHKLANDSMKALTQATGGQTYTASTLQDIPVFINNAISDSLAKPSAWLQGPIGGYVGEDITFDARGSYSINGQIVKYEWDADGDGVYEKTTANGMLTRSFDTPVDTTARVRVTDETGRIAIATAPVYVTVEPDPLPETDPSTLQDKPGVYEVLDEEAVALFPELAPVTKDATLEKQDASNTTDTIKLPDTGTPTGTGLILAICTTVIGFALIVVKRSSRERL